MLRFGLKKLPFIGHHQFVYRAVQITAGVLHAYVQQNVLQQSSGSQTLEPQGDTDGVLLSLQ